MKNNEIFLKCTKCGDRFDNEWKCIGCGYVLVTKKGVYDFSGKENYYWGEISRAEAKKLIRDSKKVGWRRASAKLETKYPGLYAYIASYVRGDFVYDAIDFNNTSSCLDIGSGWGAVTFSLARHFKEVWSLEKVNERLLFQKVRARQDGISNISFVRSDWIKLPFRDESFDFVTVNGVLEWIGLSDYKKNPRLLQKQFLKEVRRVLKPNGCVYIGIENRFAFFYFLGAHDHSGLPFTSLLPRKISDFTVKSLRKTGGKFNRKNRIADEWLDYRTYTYSYWGYRKLIADAGFDKVNIKWARTYNSPSESGDFDGRSFKYLLNLYKKHDYVVSMQGKLATKIGVHMPNFMFRNPLKVFSPSFLIYAYKSKNSFERNFLNSLRSQSKSEPSILRRSGTNGLSSKVNFFFLENGDTGEIAKVSRFKKFKKYLREEEKLLAHYGGIRTTKKTVNKRDIYFEPIIRGKMVSIKNIQEIKTVIDWLIKFQIDTRKGNWEKKYIENRVFKYWKMIPAELFNKSEILGIKRELIRFIKNASKMEKTSVHGDFVKSNIILNNNKACVIDWEFFERSGEPMFDIGFFLLNNSMVEDFTKNITGKGKLSDILSQSLDYYCLKSGKSKKLVTSSFIYVLIKALSRRFDGENVRHVDINPLRDRTKELLGIIKSNSELFAKAKY